MNLHGQDNFTDLRIKKLKDFFKKRMSWGHGQ